MKISAPKLNVQHDYISLKLPIGTFTVSCYGSKASGELCTIKGAFDILDKYVKNSDKPYLETMTDLTNPTILSKLIPGWDKPTVSDVFTIGDTAEFVNDAYKKKYPNTYDVSYARGKYVYLLVPDKKGGFDTIGFPTFAVKKIKK